MKDINWKMILQKLMKNLEIPSNTIKKFIKNLKTLKMKKLVVKNYLKSLKVN